MGKVSDQINQFTETYSTIVLGMHSDINQYRQEVKSIKDTNISLEEKLHQSVKDAKLLEQSSTQISKKIEERKTEIENFYQEISGAVSQLKVMGEDIDKTKSLVNKLDLKVAQSNIELYRLNSNLVKEQEKNVKLRSDLTTAGSQIGKLNSEMEELKKILKKQTEQISTQKLLIIGCVAIVIFILVLTILL